MKSIDIEIIYFSREFIDIDITNFDILKKEMANQNKIDDKKSINYWWNEIPIRVSDRWQVLLEKTKASHCILQLGKALTVLADREENGGWTEAIKLINAKYFLLSKALGFVVKAKNEL